MYAVRRCAYVADAPDGVPDRHGLPEWIDQSQSLNLFLPAPDIKAMSHMYRRAWRAGLKTTYYLRTLGASSIEKSSVARVQPAAAPVPVPATAEAAACSVEAMRSGEECEACQ